LRGLFAQGAQGAGEEQVTLALAVLGVILVVVGCVAGILAGESDAMLDDPDVRAEVERRKLEAERQRAWREKAGKK
jgi:hypothetical protein